ncbi:hypothetical protein BX600DRAFT_252375 [Xylariales sp. PMI_506]|nr:hypothetical protein BX600DRAFT_252375 [Xylariales sp. PMI_506]
MKIIPFPGSYNNSPMGIPRRPDPPRSPEHVLTRYTPRLRHGFRRNPVAAGRHEPGPASTADHGVARPRRRRAIWVRPQHRALAAPRSMISRPYSRRTYRLGGRGSRCRRSSSWSPLRSSSPSSASAARGGSRPGRGAAWPCWSTRWKARAGRGCGPGARRASTTRRGGRTPVSSRTMGVVLSTHLESKVNKLK